MPGVRFDVEDGVGRITLDRPEVSNAVDLPTAHAFGDAARAAADDEVRVVLVTGAGARFCAGGDVRSFTSTARPASYLHELASVLAADLWLLSRLPKPVVAGVHGAVAGAGLSFVLNSDIVIAARTTKFRMAYSGVGLTPDCGVSYLLPRAIGTQRALDFALSGRPITAAEAQGWGLITEVVDDNAVTRRAEDVARSLADGPAWALGQAKRLLRSSFEATRDDSVADEATTIAEAIMTADAQAMLKKFGNS